MSANNIVYSRSGYTFIYKRVHLSVVAVGLLLFAGACGGTSSSDSSSPSSCLGGNSSSTAERISFCQTRESKCPDKNLNDSDPEECEKDLVGTSSAFVQAFEACVSGLTKCDDHWDLCRVRAISEIAPGFPNVPIVTECKDKAQECKGVIPKESQSYVEHDCERLVVRDEAGQNRASECAKKDCDAFYNCTKDF